MARPFISLKLRLVRNGLRGARGAFFILGCLVGLQLAGWGFVILATNRTGAAADVAPVLTFTLFFLGWAVVPLVGFGVDETLDPYRLSLLPLTRRQLMVGLFLASCVGVGPVVTLVALSGSLVSHAGGLGTIVVVVAVVVGFAMCVVVPRVVTSGLGRMFRSRRMRDVGAFVVSILAALGGLALQLPRLLGGSFGSDAAVAVGKVARWFPPGMAARAMVDATAGRAAVAVMEVAGAAAFVIVLVWWWGVNLDRLLTVAPPATAATGGRRRRSLFSGRATALPRSRIGAVAAKELRMVSREPMLRAQRILAVLFAVVGVAAVVAFVGPNRPSLVLVTPGVLWWSTLGGLNAFAADRAGYWMNVAATGDPRDDLVGKNLALVLLNAPVFAVVATAVAAGTGGWPYLPASLCVAVGVLGCQLGLGNLVSVRLAQPLPETPTNPWATGPGQAMAAGFILFGAFLLGAVLLVPVAVGVAIGVATSTAALWVAAVLAASYGVAVYAVGLLLAGAWLRRHEPELLRKLAAAGA